MGKDGTQKKKTIDWYHQWTWAKFGNQILVNWNPVVDLKIEITIKKIKKLSLPVIWI